MPLFEAAYSGLPIITHDFGGQKDFLYAPKKNKKGNEKLRPHFSKVNYELKPVQKEVLWKGVIEPNMLWAYPIETNCKIAMREAVKNYGLLQGEASRLKTWLKKSFNKEDKYNSFLESLLGEKLKQPVKISDLPKISIITSIYDGDEFIEPFLKDITSQTVFKEKCELILINANSPGNEEPVIKKYLEKYPNNIVYKKLDRDPGIYGVWNIGIDLSTGEYITNANLDDRKSPDSLEMHAKHLFMNDDVDLVYSDMLITGEPNETWDNNSSQNRKYNFPEFSFENLKMVNMPHAAPMWKKTIHKNYGKFDEKYKSAGDWEMWLRAASKGSKFKKIPGMLGLYYFNPTGISTNPENFEWKREEETEVYAKYKDLVCDV